MGMQGGGGRRRQERKGNQTGRRVMGGERGAELWQGPRSPTRGAPPEKRNVVEGGSEVHMDTGPQNGKGSNWLMGRLGLDLLISVHCPLATECHSTSLPNSFQDNKANTIPARSPKHNPYPTKPSHS